MTNIDLNRPIPLYRQIRDSLREEIASGELPVGAQVASHQDLAKQYGVSLITVKRALADLINEGILFGRAGKGTFVTKQPSPQPQFQKTIGLVLKDIKSPFFSLIVHSVEAYASKCGFHLLLSNTASRMEKEESQIRQFVGLGVGGLIIASMTHEYSTSEALRELHEKHFPFVMVSYIKDPDIHFVGTDHEDGGFLATEHLIKIGYKRIGYVSGETGNEVGELRRKGYLRALKTHGMTPELGFQFHLRLRGEWNDFNSGYEIGKEFLFRPDKPDAMFIYNDLSALGFEQALIDGGLRVPEDVAIVGFDDIERGQYAPSPLTTIQQPTSSIGAIAVEHLLKMIDNVSVPTRMILKPALIVRESCGAKARTRKDSSRLEGSSFS
ncbi:MAG: GntR family transcriptional regulator [Ignavibacteriales bacterium]|nr:GntR family transcriptional regulator [Ignavibacteriales bacterium]